MRYAEEVNYWKTGKSAPDVWLERAKKELTQAGGTVIGEGFGSETATGRSAFMLAFEMEGERFKIVWPVLPSKTNNERAARIQAATMLYHDVKAKCVKAKVFGARTAFFSFLLLPDGRIAADLATPELTERLPALFGGGNPRLLSGGDIIEG